MIITFDDGQDDEFVRVLTPMVGVTVQVTARDWHEPGPYPSGEIEKWDGVGEIKDVEPEYLLVTFDDGSYEASVKYSDIEEVKYL